ncbi:MAG: prepilin-type N-terminal cleavage/methylation domain-containing protein [Candidatus Omnitrophica bacterium]|nr:prepilin-type N-terminal cleavage/methylation domain-containing protein [Candidatus Omnitrophota bacterium]
MGFNRRAAGKNGFTMAELLIVLALVAMMSALVITRFSGSYEARRSEHILKDLTAYLRYLQFKSIEESATYQLDINEKSSAIRVQIKDEELKSFRDVKIPYGESFSDLHPYRLKLSKANEVYFFPDGSVTPNKINLLKGYKEQASVEITNRLGAFKINRYGMKGAA